MGLWMVWVAAMEPLSRFRGFDDTPTTPSGCLPSHERHLGALEVNDERPSSGSSPRLPQGSCGR